MEYAPSKSFDNISNEEIVQLCQSAPRISNPINSVKVVKILPDVAVKLGGGVSQSEAATLDCVYRHADADIVRTPRVYRFFKHEEFDDWPCGYIVMEFIGGVTLEERAVGPELIKRIASAIDHLTTLPMPPSQGPGPLYAGVPEGVLWGYCGAGTRFTSLQHMKTWMNQRFTLSFDQIPPFSFGPRKLVFLHMDIAKCNIMLTEKGEMYFIDWGCAGFYPWTFQRFCIEWCSPDDQSFCCDLLDQMPGSEVNEDILLGALLRINTIHDPPDLTGET